MDVRDGNEAQLPDFRYKLVQREIPTFICHLAINDKLKHKTAIIKTNTAPSSNYVIIKRYYITVEQINYHYDWI